ncbi:hypothetical protein [Rickettsia endosymbiont of Ceutorhynchus obstrictus]|uniref:hypothetical protein n=1 Tax=Rickettsia endosymbiont of Ceutorhynchus obstrictus TaxID=3066249 RepID=UPI003132D021
MRTIAQKYIKEGKAELIKMMLRKRNRIKTISRVTGLNRKSICQLIDFCLDYDLIHERS